MRLILVRHGQSQGNATGIVQGHLDFGLTELGLLQSVATAERLAQIKIDRIISSPLVRAYQTAEAIAAATGLTIEPRPALMEYDVGAISGMTPEQIRQKHPEALAARQRGERLAFPGEEGREQFHVRVRAVIDEVRATDQVVVAVAHGGVIGAVCQIALGINSSRRGLFEIANCSITQITEDRLGNMVILHQNDVCHLAGLVTRADRG